MYAYYEGKPQVSLWCDGKDVECAESDEEKNPRKKQKKESQGLSRRAEMEEELEDVFQKLKDKHGDKHYSRPQLRLWARMIVSKTHDDLNNPPKVPMITGPGGILMLSKVQPLPLLRCWCQVLIDQLLLHRSNM